MAVDYPKTGIPAELTPELRTQEYPDFMENLKKPMRRSEKVSGRLPFFRQAITGNGSVKRILQKRLVGTSS